MASDNLEHALNTLIGSLGGTEPVPAGGAAAVVAIAMGVALGVNMCHLSRAAAPSLIERQRRLAGVLERMRPEFAADGAAFTELLTAFRMPREDGARAQSIELAWRGATAAPVAVATAAREAELLLEGCIDQVKASMRADIEAALELVRAGRRIAENNARENAQNLESRIARELLAPLDGGRRAASD